MSDFNVGDLVEARKGECIIRDRVQVSERWPDSLFLGDSPYAEILNWYTVHGFTLSLVEAATPPLPTEEGAIITWNKGYAQETAVLEKTNQWLYNGNNFETAEIEQAIDGHPFTRLEPVPDIARKVIDATIRTFNSKGGNIVDALMSVSQEFGVES